MMKNYSGKKILITGGLGFIGSNLGRKLVSQEAKVTLVDSLIPQYGGNKFNIDDFRDEVSVNICDVRDPFAIASLIQDQDYLFNLAGQTSHIDSMTDPHTDLDINVAAQLSILEVCRKENPDIKIVFASTRQLYGKPDYLPVDEKHPIRPVDVNGINKLAGEWYHLLYNNVYGIRSCALRLTNTYGPRMRLNDGRVIPAFMGQALRGEDLTVFGDGLQTRSFCYVDDQIEGLYRLLMSNYVLPVNIGNPDEISILDFAKEVVKLTNSHQKIVYKPLPQDDPLCID